MDLEARKILFVQEFLRLQNEDIIIGLEKLLRKKKAEVIENELRPMSIQQYSDEIDQAIEDSQNGRVIRASDLKEKIKKWK